MEISEAIKRCTELSECGFGDNKEHNREFYSQIAEWLAELDARRNSSPTGECVSVGTLLEVIKILTNKEPTIIPAFQPTPLQPSTVPYDPDFWKVYCKAAADIANSTNYVKEN